MVNFVSLELKRKNDMATLKGAGDEEGAGVRSSGRVAGPDVAGRMVKIVANVWFCDLLYPSTDFSSCDPDSGSFQSFALFVRQWPAASSSNRTSTAPT